MLFFCGQTAARYGRGLPVETERSEMFRGSTLFQPRNKKRGSFSGYADQDFVWLLLFFSSRCHNVAIFNMAPFALRCGQFNTALVFFFVLFSSRADDCMPASDCLGSPETRRFKMAPVFPETW